MSNENNLADAAELPLGEAIKEAAISPFAFYTHDNTIVVAIPNDAAGVVFYEFSLEAASVLGLALGAALAAATAAQ